MEKFCTQCGRPLADGEVCNCQTTEAQSQQQAAQPQQFQETPQSQQFQQTAQSQQQATQSNYVNVNEVANQAVAEAKNIFNRIGAMFKDPLGEIKNMVSENDMKSPLTLVITNLVVIFLIVAFAMVYVRAKLGDMAEWIEIPYAKIVLVSVILAAIYDFGFPAFMWLSAKVFFRENTTYAKMLSIVGGKLLLDNVFILAAIILCILSPVLGIITLVVGMLLTSLIMIMGYTEVSDLSAPRKVYSLFVAFVMYTIVYTIIYTILFANIMDSLQNVLNRIF